jgi:hypothetical protein
MRYNGEITSSGSGLCRKSFLSKKRQKDQKIVLAQRHRRGEKKTLRLNAANDRKSLVPKKN